MCCSKPGEPGCCQEAPAAELVPLPAGGLDVGGQGQVDGPVDAVLSRPTETAVIRPVREVSIECAARVFQGAGGSVSPAAILNLALAFEAHIMGEPPPGPVAA